MSAGAGPCIGWLVGCRSGGAGEPATRQQVARWQSAAESKHVSAAARTAPAVSLLHFLLPLSTHTLTRAPTHTRAPRPQCTVMVEPSNHRLVTISEDLQAAMSGATVADGMLYATYRWD
jgi:hypothetical protein